MINREKAVIVDVCEPAEYAACHVAGARNVPLSALAADNKQLPSNKALPLLVLCQSGARATRAAGVGGGLAARGPCHIAGAVGDACARACK